MLVRVGTGVGTGKGDAMEDEKRVAVMVAAGLPLLEVAQAVNMEAWQVMQLLACTNVVCAILREEAARLGCAHGG